MGPDLTIRRMTNTCPEFYSLVGPFLARRAIEKELGGRIYDDDGKTWWVALRESRVVGFCAAVDPPRGPVTWQSAYVVPNHRGLGVYRALFAARESEFPGRSITATVSAATLPVFLAAGFTQSATRGRFTKVRRSG